MKTWIDLSQIPMPPRVARMAKDQRGYPIPHTVYWENGAPDFRVIDPDKWMSAIQAKRCGICGDFLGAHLAFVGGPMSIQNRLFNDLPMHRECAHYAVQVCPFIAAPKFAFSKTLDEKHNVHEMVSDQRPDRFGLGITKGFELVRLPDGNIAIQAKPFASIEWWEKGVKIE